MKVETVPQWWLFALHLLKTFTLLFIREFEMSKGVGCIEFLSHIDLAELNVVTISIRVLLAVLVGGIIGLERDIKNHPAGFRTYILVCLGSTMVMMTNQFISETYQTGDPSRMGAQVISGIGFLGAGTILITKNNHVKGLTTAAGLWSAACIGLAIGIGFYEGALAGTISLLIIMTSFQRIKKRIVNQRDMIDCYIIFESLNAFNEFLSVCLARNWRVLTIQEETLHSDEGYVMFFLTLRFNNRIEARDFVFRYKEIRGILSLSESES